MDYSNRTYATANTSTIGNVDFSQVMQTSATTVRKSIDESHPTYSSIPASSVWHYGVTAKWGALDEVVVDEILVHNLEHAGIGIHYDCPSGCDELVKELVRIIKPYHKVIVSPYPDMQNKIVLTAWGHIDKFDVFDEKRILDFIEAHINSSSAPEPLGM